MFYVVYDTIKKIPIAETATLEEARHELSKWLIFHLQKWQNVQIIRCDDGADNRCYLITELGDPVSRIVIRKLPVS